MIRSHVVVDGSNIATEGRTSPSLRQLDDSVKAFLDEHPVETLTVVVDATFPNRIDPSERAEYEEAILAGELVTPPAGAIGRGDAFILQIAGKVGATVLSNDSFQELHPTHPWLFDEGRLIGGKPVPGVGWVFLLRSPVRGPVSRRASRDAKDRGPGRNGAAKPDTGREASQGRRRGKAPEKVPASASGRGARDKGSNDAGARDAGARDASKEPKDAKGRRARTARKPTEALNDPLPFIEFVAAHPVGSTLEGEVVTFSSHGAYIEAGGARCYVPLKLMGDPPPAKAREVLSLGERRVFAVHSLDTPRRAIDLALVATAAGTPRTVEASVEPEPDRSSATGGGRGRRSASRSSVSRRTTMPDDTDRALPDPLGVDGLGTTTGSEQHAQEATVSPAAKKAPAKKTAAKKTVAKKAPAKKTVAKKAPVKKTVAKKAPARKAPAKKTVAKKTVAKKAPVKRTVAKKAPARKAPAKKTVAKKAPAKKTVAKKTVAKKAPAKKAPAKKTVARKAPAKKTAARRTR